MVANEQEKFLFTIREAEGALGLSRATIYNLIERGELQRVKVGKSARIPRASIVAFVRRLEGENAEVGA